MFGFSMSKIGGGALSHMTYPQYHVPKIQKQLEKLRLCFKTATFSSPAKLAVIRVVLDLKAVNGEIL